MAYAGEKNPEKEADILAYLRSLVRQPRAAAARADASAPQQKPEAAGEKK